VLKERSHLILGFIVVLTAAGLLYWRFFSRPSDANKEIYSFDTQKCPAGIIDFEVPDVYMRGRLEKGAKIKVELNWYHCHEPKRDDLVLYRYSWKRDPVIKRIVALPGDTIRLNKDPEGRGWNLYVNDERIGEDDQPFFFGVKNVKPPLELYAEANKGRVKPGHVVLLSSFPPGDSDSTIFGAIDLGDVVGKALDE
jgi:signal peptidase I